MKLLYLLFLSYATRYFGFRGFIDYISLFHEPIDDSGNFPRGLRVLLRRTSTWFVNWRLFVLGDRMVGLVVAAVPVSNSLL